MALNRAQYLNAFHDVSLFAFGKMFEEGADGDFAVLVRAVWTFGKRGANEREAAEIMLGEIFRAKAGRAYDPHELKHFLIGAGIPDPINLPERPVP